MYKIVRKKELNSAVTLMEIEAPFVARKAKAGQFIIFRVDDRSVKGETGLWPESAPFGECGWYRGSMSFVPNVDGGQFFAVFPPESCNFIQQKENFIL